jgi:hypothetical protein
MVRAPEFGTRHRNNVHSSTQWLRRLLVIATVAAAIGLLMVGWRIVNAIAVGEPVICWQTC